MSDKPRLIDGIVLTKFDTIDDKVFESFCFFPALLSFIICLALKDYFYAVNHLSANW